MAPDQGPEGTDLSRMANQRAEEYFARMQRENRARYDSAMKALAAELGLESGETLEEYVGLAPSKDYVPSDADWELDPEVAAAIDDLMEKIGRALTEDVAWEELFPPKDSP